MTWLVEAVQNGPDPYTRWLTLVSLAVGILATLGALIWWARNRVVEWRENLEKEAVARAAAQAVVLQQQKDLASLMVKRTAEIQNGDSKSTLVRLEQKVNDLVDNFAVHLDDSRQGFDRLAVVEDYINRSQR